MLHGGKRVRMPNGDTMVATNTSLLPFPHPLLSAQKCDVLPGLQQPILSLGQLCDAGFTAILDSETVKLTKGSRATLSGTRDHNNELYFIPQSWPLVR